MLKEKYSSALSLLNKKFAEVPNAPSFTNEETEAQTS